jgi:hypothetical protein
MLQVLFTDVEVALLELILQGLATVFGYPRVHLLSSIKVVPLSGESSDAFRDSYRASLRLGSSAVCRFHWEGREC